MTTFKLQLNIEKNNKDVKFNELKFGDVEKKAIPYIEAYMRKNGIVEGWENILSTYEKKKNNLGGYNHNLVPDELKDLVDKIHDIAIDIYHGKKAVKNENNLVDVVGIINNQGKEENKDLVFDEMDKYYSSNPEMNFVIDEHAKQYRTLLYRKYIYILNEKNKKEILEKISNIKNYFDYQNLDLEIESLKAKKDSKKENIYDILDARELALQLTAPYQGLEELVVINNKGFFGKRAIAASLLLAFTTTNILSPTILNANLSDKGNSIQSLMMPNQKDGGVVYDEELLKPYEEKKLNIQRILDQVKEKNDLDKPKTKILYIKKDESIISTLKKLSIQELVEIQGRIGATNTPNGERYSKDVLATLIAKHFNLPNEVKEGDYLAVNKEKGEVKYFKANSDNKKIKGLEFFGDEIKIDILDGKDEDKITASNWFNLVKDTLNSHVKHTKEKISDSDVMNILSQLGIVGKDNAWKVNNSWKLRAGEQTVNLETYNENGKRYLLVSLFDKSKNKIIKTAKIEIKKNSLENNEAKIENKNKIEDFVEYLSKLAKKKTEKDILTGIKKYYLDNSNYSLSDFYQEQKSIYKISWTVKDNKKSINIIYFDNDGNKKELIFIKEKKQVKEQKINHISEGDNLWRLLENEKLSDQEIAKVIKNSNLDQVVIKPNDTISYLKNEGKIIKVNIYRDGKLVNGADRVKEREEKKRKENGYDNPNEVRYMVKDGDTLSQVLIKLAEKKGWTGFNEKKLYDLLNTNNLKDVKIKSGNEIIFDKDGDSYYVNLITNDGRSIKSVSNQEDISLIYNSANSKSVKVVKGKADTNTKNITILKNSYNDWSSSFEFPKKYEPERKKDFYGESRMIRPEHYLWNTVDKRKSKILSDMYGLNVVEANIYAHMMTKIHHELFKNGHSMTKIEMENELNYLKSKKHKIPEHLVVKILNDLVSFKNALLNGRIIDSLFQKHKTFEKIGSYKVLKRGGNLWMESNDGVRLSSEEVLKQYQYHANSIDEIDLRILPYRAILLKNDNRKILFLKIHPVLHIGIEELSNGSYRYVYWDKAQQDFKSLSHSNNYVVKDISNAMINYLKSLPTKRDRINYAIKLLETLNHYALTDDSLSSDKFDTPTYINEHQ